MAAKPFTIPGSSGTVGDTTTNNVIYHGYAVHETGGATAVARIRDGGVVGGKIIDVISLASGGVASNHSANVLARNGLYFELVSGAMEGSVFAE